MQKWHPDKLKGAGDNPRLKEQALARYHEIQEAYKGERFHLRRAELDRDAEFSDGSACLCGVPELSDPSRKAMYDAALLRQQRFDNAAHGRDTVDELSDMVDKLEIKIVKSSSSSARTGRPASGRIDLFFTFTTAAAPDEGTSRGGGGAAPRNARCAGSSSAPRRRAAPRSKLQTLIEARLRCGRKD